MDPYLNSMSRILFFCFFFFQAEDAIRDAQESRGLGDVYKRQVHELAPRIGGRYRKGRIAHLGDTPDKPRGAADLSLIHI